MQLQILNSSKLPLADSQLLNPHPCSVGSSQWAAGFITNELLINSLLPVPAGISGQCFNPRTEDLEQPGPWRFLAGRSSLEQFVVLFDFIPALPLDPGLLCILQWLFTIKCTKVAQLLLLCCCPVTSTMNPSLRNTKQAELSSSFCRCLHQYSQIDCGFSESHLFRDSLIHYSECNVSTWLSQIKSKFSIIIIIINLQGLYEAGYWHSYKGLNRYLH